MQVLLKYLRKIPDPRRAQGKRYQLSYFLLFAIFGILSGAKSYRELVRFMTKRLKVLNDMFNLNWEAAPSKSQIGKIIAEMNNNDVERAFREYSDEILHCKLGKKTCGVGLDGKALKGSFDSSNSRNMLQILSAFCATTKIILGHIEIDEKTNEIPTAQQLIKELGLPEGTIYTADAMHCQKKLLKPSRRQREN